MREKEKIMLIGIGELGGIVLEYLSRIPGIPDIVTADSNKDWGFRKTNSAILGASYMGLHPDQHVTRRCPALRLARQRQGDGAGRRPPGADLW